MKFLPYEAAFYDAKKEFERIGRRHFTLEDYIKLTEIYISRPQVSALERYRLQSEIWWLQEHKPYYKFFPSILEPAKRINLSNIPVNLLTIPGHNQSVALYFPEGNEIQNILVAEIQPKRLMFSIRVNIDQYQYCYFVCNTEPEISIDEVVDNATFRDPSVVVATADQSRIIKQSVKYFAMAKFLTDCPNEDLMTLDLPARYIAQWGGCTNKRKKEILQWSKKHGHNGYNVGLHARIIKDAGRLSESKEYGEGKEQEYSHIRTGHIHAVRFGPDKKHVKLMWYMPIVVNKDKPFKT